MKEIGLILNIKQLRRRMLLAFPISKRMITLLRHGTLPRNEDGAIEFWRLKKEFKSDFPNSVYWSIRMWIAHLLTGGGQKKRFQFCINSNGTQILYLRAIQGHSGENPVDPSSHRTTYWYPTISSRSSIMSEVTSTCTLPLRQD